MNQSGLSFIECLLALLIINIGLLGVMDVTRDNLQQLRQTYLQSQLVVRAMALAERLQANHFLNQSRELSRWRIRNQNLLPRLKSQLNCQAQHCDLSMQLPKKLILKWQI